MARLPDGESAVVCLLCPLFGPAFLISGLCSARRCLFALAAWLALGFALAGLLIGVNTLRARQFMVGPDTELRLDDWFLTSPLWCTGADVDLSVSGDRLRNGGPPAPADGRLVIGAFAAATVPPLAPQRSEFSVERRVNSERSIAWLLAVPLTPNSSLELSATPTTADSKFRLTVVEGRKNFRCWVTHFPGPVPSTCIPMVDGDPAPLNVSLRTTSRAVNFFVAFTADTVGAAGQGALARASWNRSVYAGPKQLPNSGPECRREGDRGLEPTGRCRVEFEGPWEGRRGHLVAWVAPVNRTDLVLTAKCVLRASSFAWICFGLPAAVWLLAAAVVTLASRWEEVRRRMEDGEFDREGLVVNTEPNNNNYNNGRGRGGAPRAAQPLQEPSALEEESRESDILLRTMRQGRSDSHR